MEHPKVRRENRPADLAGIGWFSGAVCVAVGRSRTGFGIRTMPDAEIIAQNESCRITRTSNEFEFVTGYKHEVYDRERSELLSQWQQTDALLDRLDEVDHRLTDEFREWADAE